MISPSMKTVSLEFSDGGGKVTSLLVALFLLLLLLSLLPRVLIRLEKPMKAIKSFPSNK